MKSVRVWRPQYSNVLFLLRSLPAVRCQRVPVYKAVGYPDSTRWVPESIQQAYGPIFSRGLSHLCPKKFSTAPEKNCYANLQNYFARLTPPSNY